MGNYNEQETLERISALEEKVQEQERLISILLTVCHIGRKEITELKEQREILYKLP